MQQPAETTQLVIAVERGADPIQGRIVEPRPLRGGFFGWLELIAALERVRGTPSGDQPPDLSTPADASASASCARELIPSLPKAV